MTRDVAPAVQARDFAQDEAATSASASTPPVPVQVPEPEAERVPVPDVYDRFSRGQKRAITAIVSFNALLSPMTASIFLPSIPAIASDLDSSATIINVTVALFIVTIGVAPLIWSPLSGFYGRRPVYLASIPIMLVSSIGVGFCRTVPQLIVTRILQGIGSSSTLSVGAGSIGDVFRPTERSNAMSYFYLGALLGPSISPVLGAAFTEYTAPGWRSAQFFVAGCAAVAFGVTYFFLPETHHDPIPHHRLCAERGKRFVPFWFNPLSILGLFGWPNISCITFISSAVMLETYVVLVPITSAFSQRYGIDNEFLLGLIFLATGGGNIVGSRIAGPFADATVKRYMAKRGFRRPEDRLKASIWGVGAIMPMTCVAYGWLLHTSAGGIAPPIVFLVLQGIGLMLALTPINTYAVDAMQSRSAEVIAVNNFMRYIFAAAASAFVLPMADSIGWGLTMTVAAIIVWIGFGVLLLVIRYGHLWRERANERYGYVTTADDEKHGTGSGSGNGDEVEMQTRTRTQTSADMERGLDSSPKRSREDNGLDEEKGDEPKDLRPAKGKRLGQSTSTSTSRSTTQDREREREREKERGELPEVKDVLRRTTSLSGASVHGG